MIVSFNLDLSPEDLAELRKAKQAGPTELRNAMKRVLRRLAESNKSADEALACLKGRI